MFVVMRWTTLTGSQ